MITTPFRIILLGVVLLVVIMIQEWMDNSRFDHLWHHPWQGARNSQCLLKIGPWIHLRHNHIMARGRELPRIVYCGFPHSAAEEYFKLFIHHGALRTHLKGNSMPLITTLILRTVCFTQRIGIFKRNHAHWVLLALHVARPLCNLHTLGIGFRFSIISVSANYTQKWRKAKT